MRTCASRRLGNRWRLIAAGVALPLAVACGGAEDAGDMLPAMVSLASMGPIIHEQPRSQDVIDGGLAMFSVSISGMGPLRCQWQRNGRPVAGANAPRLEMPSVSRSDEGVYTLVVSNNGGSVVSDAVKLSVRALDQTLRGPGDTCADRAVSGAGPRCDRVILFLR